MRPILCLLRPHAGQRTIPRPRASIDTVAGRTVRSRLTMDDAAPLKQTPLAAAHRRAGGKMIPFGGWEMPVQYRGILEEHAAVRSAVGMFDISHMGEFVVSGPGAASWLDRLLTNRVARLGLGQGQYTFLLNDTGGVIDDLILYRTAPETYFLVVNSSTTELDFAWMEARLERGVTLENRSAATAGLALQGPAVGALFDSMLGHVYERPQRNEIIEIEVAEFAVQIACTGYTGEDGFELFFPAEQAELVWGELLEQGAPFGLQPCGLGARDTLRLEMGYPLNGSDLSPTRTPLAAGLGFFVDFEKGAFVGRGALVQQREAGLAERLVPFQMLERGAPPRAHYPLWQGDRRLGEVSSGSLSPSLGIGIGLAYLPAEVARAGEAIEVDIRGRRLPARIAKKPLYKKPKN